MSAPMSAAVDSVLTGRRDPFWGYLGMSIGLHAGLIALLWFASEQWGRKVIDLDQKPIRATLVRRGKPRDAKLLPRKEESPPAPPPRAPMAAPVPVPVPVVAPTPAPKPALAKSQQQPKVDRRRELFWSLERTARPAEVEGAEDGDPLGDSAVQEGEAYYGMITAQVRRHYDVSQTIDEAERLRLRALVALTIGATGKVMAAELVRSSGNALFDAAVLSAVRNASPLSPPPDHLRDTLRRSGVRILFTP